MTDTAAGPTTRTQPAAPLPPTTRVPQAQTRPRSAVPSILVGTWDGGSEPSHAKITFTANGDVRYALNSGAVDYGTVVVQGSSMTLYMSRSTQTVRHWSVEQFDAGYGYTFLNLTLDGYSYVRQVGGG